MSKLGTLEKTGVFIVTLAVTQILVVLCVLASIFSDILVVSTLPSPGFGGFTGRCSLVSYSTGPDTVRGLLACENFLSEMTSAADAQNEVPPVKLLVNADLLDSYVVYGAFGVILSSVLRLFLESVRSKTLVVYIGAVSGAICIAALAHAETTARKLTHPSIGQEAVVGDGIYLLVASAAANLYSLGSM